MTMNTFDMTVLACLSAVMLSVSCSDSPVALPTARGEQGWYVDPYLDDLWTSVDASLEGFDTQQYFEFMVEATDLGWDMKYIRTALEKVSAVQVREEGHINYGQVPRYLGNDVDSRSFDKNCIEFALQYGSLMYRLYYDRLDETCRDLLDEFTDYAVHAIMSHDNVALTYTNICLMHSWNLICLGENLPDDRTWGKSLGVTPAQIAEKGYENFMAWAGNVRQNGIHEHNSPTYTGVQAACLGYIARYTENRDVRAEAERMLGYFSRMLFANYWETSMSCAGVQSRCYYRGSSYGLVDNIMGGLLKGWGTHFCNTLALWEPSEEDRALNSTYPRTVCYRWGEDPDMNAVAYYKEKFVIGSAGRPYTGNANEKNMTVFLGSDRVKSMVNISHYFDGRNDPYGKSKVGSVTRHLQRYAMGRAQRDNEFVAMIAGDGSERDDTKKICSHVIVPSTNVDEVWIGDTELENWTAITSRSLGADDNYTFFLRFEDVAVAIRYLYVKDIDGKWVTPALHNDTDGTSSFTQGTAMRISADLSETVPEKWDRGIVAMWWRVEDGVDTDSKFRLFRQEVINAASFVRETGDEFEIWVESPDGRLGFKGNFEKNMYKQYIFTDQEPIGPFWDFRQTETTGGIKAEDFFFSVNGVEMADDILSRQ